VGYHARLEITPGARRWAGARLLVPGARYDAVVRFSRGGGLPEPLPDALGVAVRLPDAYGPGRAQDFLVTSSADLPLLFPGRSFLHGRSPAPSPTWWTAAATGELVYELLAGSLGRSRTVGLLAVGRPLDPAATEALRFNPGPPARASCPSAASTGCAARRCQQPEGRKAGISRR
jgi:hypothetical protein